MYAFPTHTNLNCENCENCENSKKVFWHPKKIGSTYIRCVHIVHFENLNVLYFKERYSQEKFCAPQL